MLRALIDELDNDETARAIDRLHGVMRDHESPDGVRLDSRAWLVHAVR
jgi:hypothetical protein